MKKALILSLIFMVAALQLSAAALEIEKVDKGSVIIADGNNPAKFEFAIRNTGESAYYEMYSLIGVTFTPRGLFLLTGGGAVNTFDVEVYPTEEIRRDQRGWFSFEYELRSESGSITKDTMRVRIVELQDVLEVKALDLAQDKESATLTIQNLENAHLRDIKLSVSSPLFEGTKTVSLDPYQTLTFTMLLDEDKLHGKEAGTYEGTVVATLDDAEASLPFTIRYLERTGLGVNEYAEGLILRTVTTEKTNVGNVPTQAEISHTRNLLTRLFTNNDPAPTEVNKNGFFVEYIWRDTLAPAEKLSASTTTNYTIPFILLLLVIGGVIAVRVFTLRNVSVTKRVSAIKTKGGQFALRVRVSIKARSHIDNIQLIDRVPAVMKLYDQFTVRPTTMDTATRRLIWNIPRLNAGEERVFTYIVYSKINLVGKFEMPSALAVFEKEGQTHEVSSNTTYVVSDTHKGD